MQVNEKAMMSLEEPVVAGDQPKWAAKQVGSEKKHPWEDVELGPLIGQGSFGKVYRGVWNGAPVAVKVRMCRLLWRALAVGCAGAAVHVHLLPGQFRKALWLSLEMVGTSRSAVNGRTASGTFTTLVDLQSPLPGWSSVRPAV